MISKRDMNPFFQKGGFIMSNKKSKLGVISAVAAGTGTAIYLAQKAKKESGNSESVILFLRRVLLLILPFQITIVTLNAENMTATAKASIILTETTKHLHIRRNRKV